MYRLIYNRNLALTALASRKPQISIYEIWSSSYATWQRGKRSLSILFCKGTIPISEGFILMTYDDPKAFNMTLGEGAQALSLWQGHSQLLAMWAQPIPLLAS